MHMLAKHCPEARHHMICVEAEPSAERKCWNTRGHAFEFESAVLVRVQADVPKIEPTTGERVLTLIEGLFGREQHHRHDGCRICAQTIQARALVFRADL